MIQTIWGCSWKREALFIWPGHGFYIIYKPAANLSWQIHHHRNRRCWQAENMLHKIYQCIWYSIITNNSTLFYIVFIRFFMWRMMFYFWWFFTLAMTSEYTFLGMMIKSLPKNASIITNIDISLGDRLYPIWPVASHAYTLVFMTNRNGEMASVHIAFKNISNT